MVIFNWPKNFLTPPGDHMSKMLDFALWGRIHKDKNKG